MAKLKLSFDEKRIDKSSTLWALYKNLYKNMKDAGEVELRDYSEIEGGVDNINKAIAEDSDMLMKNSAYNQSKAIVAGLLGLGDFEVEGGISGDSSSGSYYPTEAPNFDVKRNLSALYGFSAGYDGENATLVVDEEGVSVAANITIPSDYKVLKDNLEYYHPNNCNNSTTPWSASELNVYSGLNSMNGFKLGSGGEMLIYSSGNSIKSKSDIEFDESGGIKFDGEYFISRKKGLEEIIMSISAPGKTLFLGDGVPDNPTQSISLQADLKDSTLTHTLIDTIGNAKFNSLIALSDGAEVLKTEGGGVTFPLGFTLSNGKLHNSHFSLTPDDKIKITMPSSDESESYLVFRESNGNVEIESVGEYLVVDNSVEGHEFKVHQSKTKLSDGRLFFNNQAYLQEHGANGIVHYGNSYYENDLSSGVFRSGFLGEGWAIKEEDGLSNATFDNLTIRRKMKIYELEIDKITATNGSIWVSSSCEGDKVELIS